MKATPTAKVFAKRREAAGTAAAPDAPRRFLGGLSETQFIARHWQKAPLLVRNAVDVSELDITRQKLLALARRADVEARLVSVRSDTWHLQHGPFEREQLSGLGARDWTVLVSDLEQHVPRLAALLQHLDFLPSWRVDDLMASFAAPGGSVGPHFDSYDVFLLQVQGERRWQIAQNFDRSALRDDTPLCILRDFAVEQQWVLGPGDLLYLPPHVAHYGVAVDAAITFSLGCRAPSLKELATQFALLAIERVAATPWQAVAPRPGHDRWQLDPAQVKPVQAALGHCFGFDSDSCLRGLGSLVSQPKALFALEPESMPSAQTVRKRMRAERPLARRRGSRWLLVPCSDATYLYVDGVEYACEGALDFAAEMVRGRELRRRRLRQALDIPQQAALLRALLCAGQLVPVRA